MSLLRISSEHPTEHVQVEGELEVGGTSLRDDKVATSLRHTAQQPPTYLSSISNLTCYKNVLTYTKHRLHKSSSAPQRIAAHTTRRRPDIVIPCHTNIECKFCQLYDNISDNYSCDHDTTSLDETEPEEASSGTVKDKAIRGQKPLSSSIRLPEVSPAEESKKRPLNYIDSTRLECSVPNIEIMRNCKRPDTIGSKYKKKLHTEEDKLEQINSNQQEHKQASTAQVDNILPTIYKLRYTKSSQANMRGGFITTAVQY